MHVHFRRVDKFKIPNRSRSTNYYYNFHVFKWSITVSSLNSFYVILSPLNLFNGTLKYCLLNVQAGRLVATIIVNISLFPPPLPMSNMSLGFVFTTTTKFEFLSPAI